MAQVPLETAPDVIEVAETLLLYDIATLINAVYQLTIEPTKEGRVPKRIAKKLYPQLQGMERNSSYDDDNDAYLDMVFALLQGMQLVQVASPPVDGMKARLQVGERLAIWGRLDVIGQTYMLLEHWQQDSHWYDVGEIGFSSESFDEEDSPSPYDYTSRYYYDSWDWNFGRDNLAARTTLLDHLRAYEPGIWYTLDTLLRDIWQQNPLGGRRSMSAQMRKAEEKKVRESYPRWYRANALNYTSMLNSTLHELGLINLGYKKATEKEGQKLDAFQITPLGTEVLLKAGMRMHTTGTPTRNEQPTEASRALIVQPSFEILLLQPDFPTLYSILPFTQVKQIDKASQLTITQASLHRGISTGRTLAQIIQVLEEHTQKELPQNVLYTLQDWAKLYKETRLSMVMLIETPNEQTARQIAGLERFQRWHVREIAPCLLTLDGDASLQEVRNALEKTGVTILLTGAFPKPPKSNDRYYY